MPPSKSNKTHPKGTRNTSKYFYISVFLLFSFSISYRFETIDHYLNHAKRLENETLEITNRARAIIAAQPSSLNTANRTAETFNETLKTIKNKQRIINKFHGGGFVIFLHIPKCGGTTTRNTFKEHENVRWLFPRAGKSLNQILSEQKLTQAFDEITKEKVVYILEIHDYTIPPYNSTRPLIQRWRRLTSQRGIPTFTFTVFREPLSHALSSFNFYHIARKSRGYERKNATDSDFSSTILPNMQCLYLARGEDAWHDKRRDLRDSFTREECVDNYRLLVQDMDWIGTLDRLSDTLEIVSNVTGIIPDEGQKVGQNKRRPVLKNNEKQRKTFEMPDLRSSTREYVEEITSWDRDIIYRNVEQSYKIKDVRIV